MSFIKSVQFGPPSEFELVLIIIENRGYKVRKSVCQHGNTATDCSISITFALQFEHATAVVPQTFKVTRSKVKVTRDVTTAKIF